MLISCGRLGERFEGRSGDNDLTGDWEKLIERDILLKTRRGGTDARFISQVQDYLKLQAQEKFNK